MNALLGARELIVYSTVCKKPETNVLSLFVAPLLQCSSDINSLAAKHSSSERAPLYGAIAEAAQALTWISVCFLAFALFPSSILFSSYFPPKNLLQLFTYCISGYFLLLFVFF